MAAKTEISPAQVAEELGKIRRELAELDVLAAEFARRLDLAGVEAWKVAGGANLLVATKRLRSFSRGLRFEIGELESARATCGRQLSPTTKTAKNGHK